MATLLLGITVVSLIVALVMSVTAWRLMREEKQRSAARIAALSAAAFDSIESADPADSLSLRTTAPVETPPARAPWKPAVVKIVEETAAAVNVSHASGFLGAVTQERDSGSRQKSLAVAAVVFFACLVGGTAWVMSAPEGTSAVALGPNAPLELVSLNHSRQNDKLAVSGLVRNPVSGKPVERLSAVVFLFDRTGTFVTSSKAHVDFLRLGAGDESPFVVSIDAPATVSRYRVSFRTDDGVVPHIDRRGESPAPAEGEQAIAATSAR
jgi:hypothetical protein